MTFSKEDKAAWLDSEIMQELEKIAREGGIEMPDEAFLPIEEEKSWEEEDEDTKKFIDAVEQFDEPAEPEKQEEDIITELLATYDKNLLGNIEKLSYLLADKSNIKAAYKVERTLQNIKTLLEDK